MCPLALIGHCKHLCVDNKRILTHSIQRWETRWTKKWVQAGYEQKVIFKHPNAWWRPKDQSSELSLACHMTSPYCMCNAHSLARNHKFKRTVAMIAEQWDNYMPGSYAVTGITFCIYYDLCWTNCCGKRHTWTVQTELADTKVNAMSGQPASQLSVWFHTWEAMLAKSLPVVGIYVCWALCFKIFVKLGDAYL